uniref:Cadherin domain-containing protein n=1 Tax=Laticauda laticaudata TaxID=8630 RepID=A0A8C5S6R7_LATLA
ASWCLTSTTMHLTQVVADSLSWTQLLMQTVEPMGYVQGLSATDHDSGISGQDMAASGGLDREIVSQVVLNVSARDQGVQPKISFAKLVVNILDVNDEKPQFSKPDGYHVSIAENTPPGTELLVLTAVDGDLGDNGTVTFILQESEIGGNSGGFPIVSWGAFRLDPVSGRLSTISQLDREEQEHYSLHVLATDLGNPALSSVVLVNVSLLDVNDNSPLFYPIQIGELVTSATATDSDSGDNADLNYSITGTNNHGTFSISPNTASIFLSKKLDFETQSLYKLNITAKDKGRPPQSSTMSVVIYVRDYNDNPPMFPAGDIFKSIVENIPIGTSVISVEAYDPDADINGQLAYTIIQQMPRGNHFHIDEVKGTIYTSAEIDREFANLFELTVKAMDQAVPIESRRFALKNVTVLITDQNDNVPTFVSPNALAVEPSVIIGTVLTTIVAADPDEGANGEVEYEIINGVTDIFILDRYSGELRVSSALVLSQLMYSFIISATDLGPERRKSTTEMTVILQGLDGPIFTHPRYITILKEGEPIGTNVISIEAASPRGPEILVEYFIVSVRGEDKKFGRLFTIGRHTGVIQTAAVLDREQGARLYLVDVYAIEKSAASPRTQKAEVKIFAFFIIFLSCPCLLSPYTF